MSWWWIKGAFLGLGFPPRTPEFDADGLMVPPWVRWPGFSLCRASFREGWGGDYTVKFCSWMNAQPDDIRERVQSTYLLPPSPSGWEEFYEPWSKPPFRCPCCRCRTLGARAGFEICPVCNWEDDGQNDFSANEWWGGPNPVSLSEARRNYREFGASIREDILNVRPPRPDELPG